jgi:pyruvate decarboxylase
MVVSGYAADGYARVNGMSTLMTVMGVGELSALNAIAGSFAEFVPVIHIVSMPSRYVQTEKQCVHHSFGDGKFETFKEMSKPAYCLSVTLDCPEQAQGQIDLAIQQCWYQSRPVAIFIPTDVVASSIGVDSLPKLPALKPPANDAKAEEALAVCIINELHAANNPIVLLGGYGSTYALRAEILDLVNTLQIPVLNSATGRGLVSEIHEPYAGLFVGCCSEPSVAELISSADLVVSIGNIQSDIVTAGFTGTIDQKMLIDLQRSYTAIKDQPKISASLQSLIQTLTLRMKNFPASRTPTKQQGLMTNELGDQSRGVLNSSNKRKTMSCLGWVLEIPKFPFDTTRQLQHDTLWPLLGNWLLCGDVVLAEAGTSSFGVWSASFPESTILISQYLWSSIGYTVGACQGAALAVRDSDEPKRRTILFIGDGSLQIACQELSTIIRLGLAPIM